jgi:hypothetical protein
LPEEPMCSVDFPETGQGSKGFWLQLQLNISLWS